MAFFRRNDPTVIKDACELSMEEFVLKYKPMTNDEILSKAYLEIRKHYKPEIKPDVPVIPQKRVTFRVIPKNIPQVKKNDVFPDEEEEDEISHDLQVENDMLSAANTAEKKNVSEKATSGGKRGRKASPDAEKRDQRILELLRLNTAPKDIVAELAKEKITVHLPQISNLKKKLAATEQE